MEDLMYNYISYMVQNRGIVAVKNVLKVQPVSFTKIFNDLIKPYLFIYCFCFCFVKDNQSINKIIINNYHHE